ncbi:2-deoxy-D-gluconate 3-dehydrogenase [Rhodovulum imhoffii]|uniref:2-deoxy-D-gluconate 3-dehydrogenase n=1 Tax=Rhodovulum imhoffii TaxID=365340 RepID=A0A2T5BPM6_9RHOB|nr:SDR family oxidoreductase [Rhodovulum imhoffii]MBK5933574.1 2-deoxy-D-gluconate 3-dehydrogenase [Rhodovulum imhoffii]PTN01013.1 2-deoxy-D-gluconate 3-dehydrogenase [Rhodovulum imhoffii]
MTHAHPKIDLRGKTALVTGASRGIGLSIAHIIAQCGADVIGVGTRITKHAPTDQFEGLSGTFEPVDCDLSDRGRIEAMIAGLDAAGRPVDILINNAGIIRRSMAAQHPIEDWDAVMAVNLDAVFLLTRELGRRMLDRGHGKIVNVASVLSFQGGILVPGYAAAKGAVAQLTRAFANEWAARGVNVNAVAPGYIATDNTAALQKDADRTRDLMARIPAGRWGTPEEIAWPVAFLASEHAAFIHGTILPVDGGWLAR